MYNLTEEQISFFKENVFKISVCILKEKLNLSDWKYYDLIKKLDIKKEKKELILYRFCPQCGKKLTYTTPGNRNESERRNKICRDCDNENRKTYYKGKNNPFFGKKHKKESIEQISKKQKGKHPTTEWKKGNIPHGKSFYDFWVKKYGKIEADKKMIEFKLKQSIQKRGSKNNMYGKPSPKGCGNGWSGWYNGWFFRSMIELSYMVNVIERFNLEWENGELKKYKIPYIDENNVQKNYFPDFVINDKYIVECKPKRLWNYSKNIRKKEGALVFCKENNLIYKMVDCDKLKINETIKLYLDDKIIFTNKYKKRIEDIIKNRN